MTRESVAEKRDNIFETVIAALFISGIAAVIIILNGGISIGYSNHTGLLPVVRRLLDPTYLPNDFNIQLRLYHHRIFAFLIAGFAYFFGENQALILLNVIGFTLLSASIYFLCRSMNLSRLAFFAVGVLIATNVGWVGRGLETNTFVGNREINPPTFAHAFVLFAIASLLRKQFKLTALFTGLTMVFHLQIGVALILILSPFYLTELRRFTFKDWLGCLGMFLLPALFTFYDLSEMFQRGLVNLPFTRADIDYRQPHHFELVSIAAAIWFMLHLILLVGVYLYCRGMDGAQRRHLFILMTLSLAITLISLLHFLDYYLLNFGSIMKVQLVRMSVFVPVFGAIALVYFLNRLAENRFNHGRIYTNLGLIILATLLYSIPATRQGFDYSFGIRRLGEQKNDWIAVCDWVKANTPTDALFVSPPGNEGFSYLTYRSNIAEFKINPDGPQYLSEWYDRLRDIAGGVLPQGKGFANNRLLNQAYASLTGAQLQAIGEKYHLSYAVLPISSPVRENVIYENAGYKVIRVIEVGN